VVWSHQNLMGSITNTPPDLLRGTVDLLILRTLATAPLHGYGIAQRLRLVSEDVLHVGESALYPSLQRLLLKGWVSASWGTSDNNRKARYYTITATGRKHLAVERAEFERMLNAMARVMRDA
jgi:PadR family transcriptional regulator, regulatory protein PadR